MKVFDNIGTFTAWDDDYYPPQAVWYYDRVIPQMIKQLSPNSDTVILDAGCGPGVHSIRVAKMGYQVHAIDFSRQVLDEARRRASSAGVLDRITFEPGDLTQLQFADESFECVFSWGVVIHVPDAAAAFRELARIVKPGGRLAIQLINAASFDGRIEGMMRFLLRRPEQNAENTPFGRGRWAPFQEAPLWVCRFDIPRVVEHFKSLGLTLTDRRAAEFSEIHVRIRGILRPPLLTLNNLWHRFRLPAGPARTNLLVFKKAGG